MSRRAEFVEDLSPGLLTREMLRLGLRAALIQGLFARAERYARRLADLDEAEGFLGLALAALRVKSPLELRGGGPEGGGALPHRGPEPGGDPRGPPPPRGPKGEEGRFREALHLLERAAFRGKGRWRGWPTTTWPR